MSAKGEGGAVVLGRRVRVPHPAREKDRLAIGGPQPLTVIIVVLTCQGVDHMREAVAVLCVGGAWASHPAREKDRPPAGVAQHPAPAIPVITCHAVNHMLKGVVVMWEREVRASTPRAQKEMSVVVAVCASGAASVIVGGFDWGCCYFRWHRYVVVL